MGKMSRDKGLVEWRVCQGFPDYEISEYGDVRRLTDSGRGQVAGHVMRQFRDRDGYMRISLRGTGGRKQFFVHRLVALSFVGCPPSENHQVAHNDGSKDNNHFTNLRWATPAENQGDRLAHGTDCRGEKHGKSVIADKDVEAIRVQFAFGAKLHDLAWYYNASDSVIAQCATGLTRKHIKNHLWINNLIEKRVGRGRQSKQKLDSKAAAEILSHCKAGVPQKKIAAKYGVSQSLVSLINNGKAWRDI